MEASEEKDALVFSVIPSPDGEESAEDASEEETASAPGPVGEEGDSDPS